MNTTPHTTLTPATVPGTAPTATMAATVTLADLTGRTGLDVLDHLEREVTIPVVDGLQAQGDLIVVPRAVLPDVEPLTNVTWTEVPSAGVELLRSTAGGNPHTLVADPGTCRWTTAVRDPQRLALGLVRAGTTAYLIHPEHGGTGLAPGEYVIRRQRERGAGMDRSGSRLVAD